jgi:hypothetical protein
MRAWASTIVSQLGGWKALFSICGAVLMGLGFVRNA